MSKMSKKNKSSIDELFSLAVQNQRNNNLQVSKDLYKKIIKLNPKFIKAYNNLGLIFQKMGENKNALRCYEKVIQVNPDLANVQYNLGLIFEQLDENEKAKNETFFDAVLSCCDCCFIFQHCSLTNTDFQCEMLQNVKLSQQNFAFSKHWGFQAGIIGKEVPYFDNFGIQSSS